MSPARRVLAQRWLVVLVLAVVCAAPTFTAGAAPSGPTTGRPVITAVSPRSGPQAGGNTVTIRGRDLGGVKSVTIGGERSRRIHVVSASKVTVVLPRRSPGRYAIRVNTTRGRTSTTSRTAYQYLPAPRVTGFRLVTGGGRRGSTVSLSGHNFTKDTTVRFGRTPAHVVSTTATSTVVTVPTHRPGRLDITATTDGGTSALQPADQYPMPTSNTQRWTDQTHLDQYTGRITDMSCPTTTTCYAVASDSVWKIADGVWSQPYAATASAPAGLINISCATDDFCAGVSVQHIWILQQGSWTESPGMSPSVAATEVACPAAGYCLAATSSGYRILSAGVWSDPIPLPTVIRRISCIDATHCIGIGWDTDDGNHTYLINGATWNELPALSRYDGSANLSCSSSGLCVLVDQDGGVTVWNGTAWGDTNLPDPALDYRPEQTRAACVGATCYYDSYHSLYTYDASTDSWSATTSAATYHLLGCTGPTACFGEDDLGHTATFDGVEWTKGGTQLATVGPISSMDCSSPTFCAAADEAGNVYTYDGSAWSSPHRVTDTFYERATVACATPTFCLALFGDGAAASYDGTRWSDQPATHQIETSVSCPSPQMCVAVGPSDSERFDGISWTVVDRQQFLSLSCATAEFCAAVTPDAIETFDGRHWIDAVDDNTDLADADPQSISCPTVAFCLAIDGRGREITDRDGVWSQQLSMLTSDPMTVSCYSAHFCQILGFDVGQTFDGTNWSAIHVASVSNDADSVTAMSCYGVGTCRGADGDFIFQSEPA